MSSQIKLRRGTTSQHGTFTGAEGEVTVDTDKDTLVVHDGSTAGGHEIMKADASNYDGSTIASFRSTGIDDNASSTALTIDASGNTTLGGNLVIPNSGTIGSASDTNAITIDSSGNVTLAEKLIIDPAKGIQFRTSTGGSGTFSSGILDDYEEGTWTPVYEAASGSAGSGTSIKGFYIKIGRLVLISGTIEGGRGTLTGAPVKITGLPFNVLTDTAVYYAGGISIGRARLFGSAMPYLSIALVNNTDEMYLYKNATDVTSDAVDSSDLHINTNYNEIYFGGTYLTD